jgi:isoleucyl-tRNA synthetase
VAEANSAFQNYEHYKLIEAFQAFDEEFSNWYLRRSRRRFWKSEADAYQTLYAVLTTVTRVMAPALPFLTEDIYQNLVRSVDPSAPESVHLTQYPQVNTSLIDEALEHSIEAVIRIKNQALSLRTQSKVKIRQPLSTLYVLPRDEGDQKVLDNPDYVSQILEETNIKKLELIDHKKVVGAIRLKADAKKIGPRAGRHLKEIGAGLAAADPAVVLKGQPYSLQVADQTFELAPDEIKMEFDFQGWETVGGPESLKGSVEQGTFLALDSALTPELLQEGLARDFNRMLQDQRKALNLDISDRIAVSYSASPRIAEAITTHAAFLRNELLAERLELSPTQNGGVKLALSGEDVFVTITRV